MDSCGNPKEGKKDKSGIVRWKSPRGSDFQFSGRLLCSLCPIVYDGTLTGTAANCHAHPKNRRMTTIVHSRHPKEKKSGCG